MVSVVAAVLAAAQALAAVAGNNRHILHTRVGRTELAAASEVLATWKFPTCFDQ